MSETVQLDMLQYLGNNIPNVPFNRLSVLTIDAVVSSANRGRILTDRDTRVVVDFIMGNMRYFSILQESPTTQILSFWEEASLIKSGPSVEYLNTFIMETFSMFRANTSHLTLEEIAKLITSLYPQLKLAENTSREGPLNDLVSSYKNSQSYLELPDSAVLEKLILTYPWVMPWMVISNTNFNLIESLIHSMSNLLVRAVATTNNETPPPPTESPS